jgi:hypothetical protein
MVLICGRKICSIPTEGPEWGMKPNPEGNLCPATPAKKVVGFQASQCSVYDGEGHNLGCIQIPAKRWLAHKSHNVLCMMARGHSLGKFRGSTMALHHARTIAEGDVQPQLSAAKDILTRIEL